MADLGAKLRSLIVEHPNPDAVSALYRRLGVDQLPEVRKGPKLRYRAQIATASGLKELT
jgi:hypothetical protein